MTARTSDAREITSDARGQITSDHGVRQPAMIDPVVAGLDGRLHCLHPGAVHGRSCRHVANKRFSRLEGVAETDPFNTKDPYDPCNRRMSVTLLRD